MVLRYTLENLSPVIAASTSWAEVLRKFGLGQNGGTQNNIKKRVEQFGISTEHFKGQSWSRDLEDPFKRNKKASDYLKFGVRSNRNLKHKLVEEGYWKYECQICGVNDWQNRKLVLQIDHIDGDN